jgi:hypothetical protein
VMRHGDDLHSCPGTLADVQDRIESTPCALSTKYNPESRGLDPRIHPEIVIPGRELSAKLTKSILRWASEPGIQNSARCWIPGMRPRGRIPE